MGLPVMEKTIFKVFAIFSHGGNLGHVTLTININFEDVQGSSKRFIFS